MTDAKSRPRQNKATAHDLIVEFKAPDTGRTYYIPILVESIQELERDDLGQLIRDDRGDPKPVLRVSHSYIQVPRVHPQYKLEMEEQYRILHERAKAEREYSDKNKTPKVLAELAA